MLFLCCSLIWVIFGREDGNFVTGKYLEQFVFVFWCLGFFIVRDSAPKFLFTWYRHYPLYKAMR